MLAYFRNRTVQKKTPKVSAYIDENYVEPRPTPVVALPKRSDSETVYHINEPKFQERNSRPKIQPPELDDHNGEIKFSPRYDEYEPNLTPIEQEKLRYLRESWLRQTADVRARMEKALEKTFTEKVAQYIDDSMLLDSQVYKRAQMDRLLFSKIMSDVNFKPSKDTALALAFALRLDLPKTIDLLKRAGYTLSHSDRRDIAIEFMINDRLYDLISVNMILDNLGLKTIGR